MNGLAGRVRQLGHGFFAILTVAGCAWGCGGKLASDSQATRDAGSSMTKEQFIQSYVASSCEYFASCPDVSSGFAPGTNCTETFFENPRYFPWLSPPLRFDPLAGAACLDAMAQLSCSRGTGIEAAVVPCFAVFRGDADAGATCSVEEDCKAELTCDFAAGCPGVCTPAKHVGESCTQSRCETGLTCGAGMICLARARQAAKCETGTCESGTMCDSGVGGTNTCRPYSEFVATRSTGQQCRLSLECSTNDYCDLDTWLCTKKLGTGAPCRPLSDDCMDGMHCSSNGDGTGEYPGKCVANVPVGGTCDSDLGVAQCESGARCISGACGYVVGLGEPCKTHDACMSNYCAAWRCAVKPACLHFTF